jgi:hypothetical protein
MIEIHSYFLAQSRAPRLILFLNIFSILSTFAESARNNGFNLDQANHHAKPAEKQKSKYR